MSSTASIRSVGRLHEKFVLGRRVNALARILAELMPPGASVLDVGCGSGAVASLIMRVRPDVRIQGVEVLVRPGCKIPCQQYDGKQLPFEDARFDVCMCVDVLHHTDDVAASLRELARASSRFLLIKDHLCENRLDFLVLKFMDWVGNRPLGVVLPYRYQSRRVWKEQFRECGLEERFFATKIPLYPVPVGWIAARRLHFAALLEKAAAPARGPAKA
jgi:SAM-dependent methyltransferase